MHNIRKLTLNLASKGRRKILNRPTSRCISNTDNPADEIVVPPITSVNGLSIPKGILGQPTCHTHPHLVPIGHLTCGITQAEYKERRDTLINKLICEVENENISHVIVIPAACKQYMSDKIPYVFRQNSDFFYLTGCMEPSAIMMIVKPALSNNYKTVLFVNEKDSHAELWEGPRTGCSAAIKLFSVDDALPIDMFHGYFSKTVSTSKLSVVWYQEQDSSASPEVQAAIRGALAPSGRASMGDPQRALHFMRVIKSPAEVELMRETCIIGANSINMAMRLTSPGMSEHILNAVLDYSCRQGGAEHLAFPPVVAGGARATHIHYVTNNQLLHENEMVLVDSGSQRWLYNSDISRTWPVSGKFSPYHRILYELVLTVQKRLIELLGEHRPPLDQLFDQMCRLLGKHLQEEGILPKNIDNNELIGRAYRLCPHHVSHYLGLDVHDAPLVRRSVPVETNMIVTVEPGIYIRPDDLSVPAEFRGVGIRVEDDVLITQGAPEVLTAGCYKDIADIEANVGKSTL